MTTWNEIKDIPLEKLSKEQWESVCDGCAKCCVIKLEEPVTKEVAFTWVNCSLLDCSTCQCSDYENRLKRVKDCLKITPQNLDNISHSLPKTCAYRLLNEGKELPSHHHLISNDRSLIHQLDYSILGKTMSEVDVDIDEIEDFIVEDDEF